MKEEIEIGVKVKFNGNKLIGVYNADDGCHGVAIEDNPKPIKSNPIGVKHESYNGLDEGKCLLLTFESVKSIDVFIDQLQEAKILHGRDKE